MLMALMKGKLSREQENMEDVLTSNVFGTLKYVDPAEGLMPFLGRAKLPNGDKVPFARVTAADVSYKFWPWWQEGDCIGCEPDVVLRIDCVDKRKYIILVEAKYHSGKSSEAEEGEEHPTDQLAREWDNLTHYANRENRTPVLIYLTAGFGCPVAAIKASEQDFRSKRCDETLCPFTCYWLSWRHLPRVLKDRENPMLQDLEAVLRHLNLMFFEGISEVRVPGHVQWAFRKDFDWTMGRKVQEILWRFES